MSNPSNATRPARCAATNSEGQPCGLFPVRGARVCHKHGGSAPQVRAAAARRVAEAEALKEVRRRTAAAGPMSIEEVYQGLIESAGSLKAFQEYLAEQIDDLTRITYTDVQGVERMKEVTEAWRRYMQDYTKVLSTIANLNLEERVLSIKATKVKANEAIGLQFAGALRLILSDLQLTPEQWDLTKTVIPKRMRELEK